MKETKNSYAKLCEKYFERHNRRSLHAQNPERNLKSFFNFDVHVKSEAIAMDFFAVAVTSRPSRKTAITLVCGAIVSGK